MEEIKDYYRELNTLKNAVINEIRDIVKKEGKIEFNAPYVHLCFFDSEAVSEDLSGLDVDENDALVVLTWNDGEIDGRGICEKEMVFCYDLESLIRILERTRQFVRVNKIAKIHKLLTDCGGSIEIKDSKEFLCADEGYKSTLTRSYLKGLEIKEDRILVKTIWIEDGNQYDYYDDCILDEYLDSVIECVKSQLKHTFVIRVSGSFSRCFEIEASSYEEALAEAKKDWEINPLCYDDSNGEDWEDYTKLAH